MRTAIHFLLTYLLTSFVTAAEHVRQASTSERSRSTATSRAPTPTRSRSTPSRTGRRCVGAPAAAAWAWCLCRGNSSPSLSAPTSTPPPRLGGETAAAEDAAGAGARAPAAPPAGTGSEFCELSVTISAGLDSEQWRRQGGRGKLPPYGWTSKNYVICVCFHCHGTSSYHTTNTLQGRRAKSHVDTQTGTGGLRTLDPL